MQKTKVMAYRYSNELAGTERKLQEVELLGSKVERGSTTYLVKTQDGIVCTAVWNPFTCCYFADDVYGVIEKHQCDSNMNIQ